MTTFTLTVDDQAAEHIRRAAAHEHKAPAVVAAQMLEWAAAQQALQGVDRDDDVPETLALAMRQKQIRQIFERNEW